jgi:hypothetical protein
VKRVGVDPDRAGIENLRYREKLKAIDKAVAKRQWSKFVYLHERPYRLDAFMDIAGRLSNKNFGFCSPAFGPTARTSGKTRRTGARFGTPSGPESISR